MSKKPINIKTKTLEVEARLFELTERIKVFKRVCATLAVKYRNEVKSHRSTRNILMFSWALSLFQSSHAAPVTCILIITLVFINLFGFVYRLSYNKP